MCDDSSMHHGVNTLEIKDITTKNIVNKYNLSELEYDEENFPIILDIYSAS